MGYHNELTWIQNGPRDEMAVAIFGIKSNNKINRVPSRIPISIKHTQEGDRFTDYPTRDRDRRTYPQEVDVRYFRKFRNKIRSTYSCNQQLCPMIKRRMEEHLNRRHCKSRQDIDSQTIILDRPSNRSTKSGHNVVDSHSIQTNINKTNSEIGKERYFEDFDPLSRFNNHDNNMKQNNNNIDRENDVANITDNNNLVDNTFDDSFPLKITETRSIITPENNNYKDNVLKAVRQWFQDVPIYQNHLNVDEDNLINDLTENINRLSFDVTESYDRKLKQEIDSFLNNACMWYPGAKRDQDFFKNKLNNNLFKAIKNINTKLLQIDDNNNRIKFIISLNAEEIENEVTEWFNMIKVRKSSGMHIHIDKRIIVQAIVNRVTPLLKMPINTCKYKTIVKCEIIEVLNNLPVATKCSKSDINSYHLYKSADELADRLLAIKAKAETKYSSKQEMYQVHNDTQNSFAKLIKKIVDNCLNNTRFEHQDDLKTEIVNIIMDYIDSTVLVDEYDVNKEMVDALKKNAPVSGLLASNVAKNILKKVKYALKESRNGKSRNVKRLVTRKTSVYTAEESCCSNFPAASTPKKRRKDSIPKLSPEEIAYAENVGNLIRAWMETLPEQFNAPDEVDFKETMIKDLAGEITDEAKLEQLASVDEKEKWLKYLIYKWLYKLDVFDLEEVSPQIKVLLKSIQDIPVPVLTKPQHGKRQAMANIKHMESELGWEEYFVPKGRDILEDEISIWMNQQSDIFEADRNTRNEKIHELAIRIENKLGKIDPKNEINKDLTEWLGDIVKNDQRTHINELANHLKGRLVHLPKDSTLAADRDRKAKERAEHIEAKRNPLDKPVKIKDEDTIKLDKTMQKFISKFIEHNYDVDDPMARGAFSHLLKTKLQRLNPPTRKEVYDNFAKTNTNKQFSREKFMKELDYIKEISDWLKNIPTSGNYNTVGNRERVDFVVDLARNILEVEEQREEDPEAMDYNTYMAAIISQFLVQLPILEEFKNDKNMMFMIDQLVGRIVAHRNKIQMGNDSIDTSGVHSDNIGDFIEEFMRVNGSDVGDDEVKLEAWSARLLDEIKKIIRDNADPKAVSKAQVYNRLTNVPKPGEESIKQFEDEFEYVKEISGWLKNLPLLPIDASEEEERIKMICVLTEKITERDIKKSNDGGEADANFLEYIKEWISNISLDESHEVIADIVIKQLINRIERAKKRESTNAFVYSSKTSNTKSVESTPNISKKRSSKTLKARSKQVKHSASNIVDAIEKWSYSLPIKADDEKSTKILKDDITKTLFQKVGELSVDPRTFNDDLLYQEILTDEVDAIIDKISDSPDLQKNKDKLRTDLVKNVVEAHKQTKENFAGEYYKQKLEHTIEASMPHPVNLKRDSDPGFEIYKSRLADIFILENFDRANDDAKLKYERNLKNEIDKYFACAQNKNSIPLTANEIYNELYSALFKVPIPNESSVEGEVEEIKTRCEIDGWLEQLPLKKAEREAELLDRDKVLGTLAKRIHEIEKTEPKPDDKIHKEIMRWINKLNLLPGEENNMEHLAKKLQETLKSSVDNRKYVASEPSSKNKKVKGKSKSKEKLKVIKNDSTSTGPSSEGKQCESHLELVKPKKKAAEIIIDIVEEWCNQLPISATTPQEEESAKIKKDILCTKIIIKISDLNMNPNTFNDVTQFNDLLDEELDILLADIPTCCDFEASKPARKMQLKDAIESVKPLFREEKARYQYKQDLDTTVAKVLGKTDEKDEKDKSLKNLKGEIVENFILYNYDKEDDEERLVYKQKVYDAIAKFQNKDPHSNVLMQRNQILCELAKVRIPSEVSYKDEVEEIRMKNEVSEFFDELNISEDKNKNVYQVKSNLAKKLNEIELHRGNDGDNNMIQEVLKSLKKVNKNAKAEVVGNFVKKLRGNEIIRRAPRKVSANSLKMADKIPIVLGENTAAELDKEDSHKFDTTSDIYQNKSVNDETKFRNCNLETEQKHTKLKESIREQVCHCSKAKENTKGDAVESDGGSERDKVREMTDVGICVCGGVNRRACLMPMRWYCGPEDFSVCKMPAGFYYY